MREIRMRELMMEMRKRRVILYYIHDWKIHDVLLNNATKLSIDRHTNELYVNYSSFSLSFSMPCSEFFEDEKEAVEALIKKHLSSAKHYGRKYTINITQILENICD